MNKIYIFVGFFIMMFAVGTVEAESMPFNASLFLLVIGGTYSVYGAFQLNEEHRNRGE